jgi:hypothetical protein
MPVSLKSYKPETNIELHKDIRFHPDLNAGEKMFYAEIQSMSREKSCPFSSRKLMGIFGVSHQTILNWVKKLIDLDLIEVGIDYKNEECRQFIKTKKKN